MPIDVVAAAELYGSRMAGVAARILRARLGGKWTDLANRTVLAVGYPPHNIERWRDDAHACVAPNPSQIGVALCLVGQANLSRIADEEAFLSPIEPLIEIR